jgi:hypothetical protein
MASRVVLSSIELVNEGIQDDQVQEGNDNVNVENEEDEITDQEVQNIEPIVNRNGRTVKKHAHLENYAPLQSLTVMIFLKIIAT